MAQLKNSNVMGDLSITGKMLATTIEKLGGTADQLLVADGNVTTIVDLLNASSSSGYPRFKDGNWTTSPAIYNSFNVDSSRYIDYVVGHKANNTTVKQYIGGHNTGDTNGAIIINPNYDGSSNRWELTTNGLYVGSTNLYFNQKSILTENNYETYITSFSNNLTLSGENTITIKTINAPTASEGTEYGPGTSGRVLKTNGTTVYWASDSNTVPSAICSTAAATAEKTATCTYYTATEKSYIQVVVRYANTSAKQITLNINSTGAKPIYINGAISSTTNYTLPAGSYLVYYDGTNYYFRTDGLLPIGTTKGGVSSPLPIAGGTMSGALTLARSNALLLQEAYLDTDNTTVIAGSRIRAGSNTILETTAGMVDGVSTNGIKLGSINHVMIFRGKGGRPRYTSSTGSDLATLISDSSGFMLQSDVTGTSGYLAKFTGTNSVGNGPALGTDITKFLRNDGTWNYPTYTTGFTIGGNGILTFESTASANVLTFKGSTRTDTILKIITNDSGNGIRFGLGGLLLMGAGNSHINLASEYNYSGNYRHAIIGSDNSIQFFTNCATIANRKLTTYEATGNWVLPGDLKITKSDTTGGISYDSALRAIKFYFE